MCNMKGITNSAEKNNSLKSLFFYPQQIYFVRQLLYYFKLHELCWILVRVAISQLTTSS